MAGNERFEDSIGRWLEEAAPNRLPGRVLDATFERTRRTTQEPAKGIVLRRPYMPRFIPALGGAVVVVTAAALLLNVLPFFGPAGTATPPPAETASPSTSPGLTATGRPEGIFADVGGWIPFGTGNGIWALDPGRPRGYDSLVRMSPETGAPLAWSPDGSKLLVRRVVDDEWELFVLHADGRTTHLARAAYRSGGDFTPSGSQVVYAADGGIYVIDAAGGTPELLHAAGSLPALSPDGTQIAFFDGSGDHGHSLQVMDSDGTAVRVLLENSMTLGAGHVSGLDWSPDGQHLVFALDSHGVFVVGIDGSGLMEVSTQAFADPITTGGANPHWSPDGSLISYNRGTPASLEFDALVIVRPDGAPVREFNIGLSGPWNPR